MVYIIVIVAAVILFALALLRRRQAVLLPSSLWYSLDGHHREVMDRLEAIEKQLKEK